MEMKGNRQLSPSLDREKSSFHLLVIVPVNNSTTSSSGYKASVGAPVNLTATAVMPSVPLQAHRSCERTVSILQP